MLVKALVEWLASLWYEMVENILSVLLGVFTTDLNYFAEHAPVISEMQSIFLAAGWALLIGNLVFQSIRSMASGIGVEGEEPQLLFTRTFLFGFLLLASPQICRIGIQITGTVTEMLKVPTSVAFTPFDEGSFETMPNAGWFVVIIINIVIQWQFIKLFFEVAERYVVLCVLTYLAPLAFAMGGSKSTGEIFRGWVRMFASMCALMVFNVFFVKLVLSALGNTPSGLEIVPWAMFIIGIVRVAKKMDGLILRIGLNPAMTGDPLGSRLPGVMAMVTARTIANGVLQTVAGNKAPPGTQRGGSHGESHTQRAGAAAYAGAKSGHAPRADSEAVSARRTETVGADRVRSAGHAGKDTTPVAGKSATAGSTSPLAGEGMRAAAPSEAAAPVLAPPIMPVGVRTAFEKSQGMPMHSAAGMRAGANRELNARARRIRKAIMIEADDFDDDFEQHGTAATGQLGQMRQQTVRAAETTKSARGSVMPPVPPIPRRDFAAAEAQDRAAVPQPQRAATEQMAPVRPDRTEPMPEKTRMTGSEVQNMRGKDGTVRESTELREHFSTYAEEKTRRPDSVPMPPAPKTELPVAAATSGMDGLMEKHNAPQAVPQPQGGSHVRNTSVQAGSFSAGSLDGNDNVGVYAKKPSVDGAHAHESARPSVSPHPHANGGGATRMEVTPIAARERTPSGIQVSAAQPMEPTRRNAAPAAAREPEARQVRPPAVPASGGGQTHMAVAPTVSYEPPAPHSQPVQPAMKTGDAAAVRTPDQSAHYRHMSGAEDLHRTVGRADPVTPIPEKERLVGIARTVNPVNNQNGRAVPPPMKQWKRGDKPDGRRKK